MRNVACAIALVAVAACGTPGLPEGSGQGLVTHDRRAPDGARTVERPTWTDGDRFVYRRGGQLRLALRVIAEEDGFRLVEEATGLVTRLGPDLEQRGQEAPDAPELERVLAPGDTQLCWPLWAGKRWTCHFLRKAPGQLLPVWADYVADQWESVTAPAGRFECLRIWRRVRPAIEGSFFEQVDLLWYSPDAGYFVQKLEDGVITELAEVHRQAP